MNAQMGRRLAEGLTGLGILAAGCLPALAGPVEVLPRRAVLVSGETATFKASDAARDGMDPLWEWSVQEPWGGSLPLDAGIFKAPPVEQVSRFRVRAFPAADPASWGEAVVTVLPREPFLSPGAAQPLPFRIPGTTRRFGSQEVMVYPWFPSRSGSQGRGVLLTAFGRPVTLRWDRVRGSQADLLSYQEGNTFQCRNVTGLEEVTLRLRAHVSHVLLESLAPLPGRGWKSFMQCFCIGVRGLVPFAGGPPGLVRFREPVGLARLGGGMFKPVRFVVADASSHTLRCLSRDGEDEGRWGEDGKPGYRDGEPAQARFNQPTHVTVNRCFKTQEPWQYSYGFLVSDTGNQVIRKVDSRGRVTTLAGRHGQAGYRDAQDPGQALFREPQGLVMDREGNVFVADQGNHVLRRISRDGQVTTLAGEAGVPGSEDGSGSQARFHHLEDLAQGQGGQLYVLDGHALRLVTLAGEVRTLLGAPDQSGFRDDWAQGVARLAGIPCLKDPSGVFAVGGKVFITDRGNHALREYDSRTGTLKTLAGDPLQPQTCPGPLREGVQRPLDASCGLGSPRGLVGCESGDLYVSTGSCVVRLCRQSLLRGPAPVPPRSVPPDGALGVEEGSQ